MTRIIQFFQSSSASGICLFMASLLGIVMANSTMADGYVAALQAHLGPLSVLHWINDGLMAIFFLFVGLEVKREMLHGELNTNAKRFVPGLTALIALMIPGLIYYMVAGGTVAYRSGWAIPTATDIAFALGIVSLLGPRVPTAMKAFLTALAIMDDLMAIVIIAVFYTSSIAYTYIAAACILTGVLFFLNKRKYVASLPYVIVGTLLWYCVFKSGLHATLAGVIVALLIPYQGTGDENDVFPLETWEHKLTNWVGFIIVPLFGFANAGVSFASFTWSDLLHPVVLGIAGGLVVGKQVGVLGTLGVLVKTKLIAMPKDTKWTHIYGIAAVCGIGFTMSLFISLLAFAPGDIQEKSKIGVFLGSTVSGIIGYLVLRYGCEQ